ncbi:cupin domain-containing protein [Luteithermobacter gelatinilyticus]|uniref:cupin domain-containing protein n=1 Tax=Luteithermobacter gelatinilyticus TaxID=2582913 RepID=UPI001105B7D5|nr:cupin domain-containing protein [Luteithermobacter gelatinilyticus]
MNKSAASDGKKRPDNVVNAADLNWEEVRHGAAYHYFRKSFTMASGAEELGSSLYRQPPGKKAFPKHYHLTNEEAIFVLEGKGTLIYADQQVPIRAGDYVALRRGADHAHQVWNSSDKDLVYLCISTMKEPEVAVYPDSGKIGILAGIAPGGDPKKRTMTRFFYPQDAGYWDGEE